MEKQKKEMPVAKDVLDTLNNVLNPLYTEWRKIFHALAEFDPVSQRESLRDLEQRMNRLKDTKKEIKKYDDKGRISKFFSSKPTWYDAAVKEVEALPGLEKKIEKLEKRIEELESGKPDAQATALTDEWAVVSKEIDEIEATIGITRSKSPRNRVI